nr:MAG TPA: hypothetical protein [Caudoviricetes sp.]
MKRLKLFSYLCKGIRTKNIQRKNKFYTNEHNSSLRPISYLCPIYQGYIQGL